MSGNSPRYYRDVDDCVDFVLNRVGSRIVMALPLALGKPNQLANAFFRRAKRDAGLQLKIFTALSLELPSWSSDLERRFLEPLVERVFGDYPPLEFVSAVRTGTLPPNVELVEFFIQPGAFLDVPYAQQHYLCSNYTHVPRDLKDQGLNVGAQMIAPRAPGDRTLYSVSCNADLTRPVNDLLMEARADGRPVATLGQVNRNLPFMFGDAVVQAELFDAIVDNPTYDFRLFGPPKMPVTASDYMIGLYASALVRDGGTIQIGIGSLGDALVYGLQLRHDRNDLYRRVFSELELEPRMGPLIDRIGGYAPFERGLYGCTELLVDGFLHLYHSGILKRRVYDHAGLQRLLNEGRIDESVSRQTLETLLEEDVIRTPLTRRDFDSLQEFGVIRDGLAYGAGYVETEDGVRVSVDLQDERNLARFCDRCLGDRLRNGVVAHGSFFLGPQAFYDALRRLPEDDRRRIRMTGVDYVNQLYGDQTLKTLQRTETRFFNSAIMATLSGAIVSDGLEDGQVVSGVGGQYNFVAMAHALPGGRSIILLKSVRTHNGRVTSNVLWNYGHTTIPRHLRDIVVTEYGVADVRGKTDQEVIQAMINVADSRFQGRLLRQAKAARKIPPAYRIPDRFRNNVPERLEAGLAPFKMSGRFPAFPFGTDLTDEELVLGKALTELKEVLRARRMPRLPLRRLKALLNPPREAQPYLTRLNLDHPSNFREKLLQTAVLYALTSGGYV